MDTLQEVLYGDARELLKAVKTHSIDLCLTDPPYRMRGWDSGFGSKGGEEGLSYHVKPPEYEEWFWEVKRVLKERGQFIIFENSYNLHAVLDALAKYGMKVAQIGIWHATNRQSRYLQPYYYNRYDVWVWAIKARGYTFHHEERGGDGSDVKVFSTIRAFDKRVPGIKPLLMIEQFVLTHTSPGDWVLDPFVGSGTTGLACRRTGRNFIGMELRKELRDTIDSRMKRGVELERFIYTRLPDRDRDRASRKPRRSKSIGVNARRK